MSLQPPQPHTLLTIHTDGGSRGNPGPAALGVVVYDVNHQVVYEASKFLGVKTNNEAEYLAFLESLEWVVSQVSVTPTIIDTKTTITWKLDSKLVVEQLAGHWKIKLPHLKEFVAIARQKLQTLPCAYTIVHVPREENSAADALVNQALDSVQ